MDAQPNETQIEQAVKLIEQAVRDGRADSELAARGKVRQTTVDSLIKAEQIDPKKLRMAVNM